MCGGDILNLPKREIHQENIPKHIRRFKGFYNKIISLYSHEYIFYTLIAISQNIFRSNAKKITLHL